jgi:hypothetical protein
MSIKKLFSKKLEIIINELFDGDFNEFKEHIPMSEKRLRQYLDKTFCQNKILPSKFFLNLVNNEKKNKFFKEVGLKSIDFEDSIGITEFRKKLSGTKEVYFNVNDLVGSYHVYSVSNSIDSIEIKKFRNDKHIAIYYFNDTKLKSFDFQIFFHQIFIKFKHKNNDIISLDLYKQSGKKDILFGTLQGLDNITHLPYSAKVSLIKEDYNDCNWDHIKNLKEKISFHESDLQLKTTIEEKSNHCLSSFDKSVEEFIEKILKYKTFFELNHYNFYYLYIMEDIKESLTKQKNDLIRDKSYHLHGKLETGKMFFKYINNYATLENPNIECFLITTPKTNFDKSIYNKAHSEHEEYQNLSLNLAKKIIKINRIFIIEKKVIFNRMKELLLEQHCNNINIYICKTPSITNYIEIAYTSRKKHVVYIRRSDVHSVVQVTKGLSLISEIDVNFKQIIKNENTKKLDFFLDDENNFDLSKINRFYKIQ